MPNGRILRCMTMTNGRKPTKTRSMLKVEQQAGEPLESLFRRLYVDQGMTTRQMGEILGIAHNTVSLWMDRLGIPAREQRWVAP